MAVQGVGKRYAEAVFDLASKAGTQQAWLSSLESLASAATDDETRAYFENPAVSDQDKEEALSLVLGEDEGSEAYNLARLLIRRRRFSHLPGILEAFEELMLNARGSAIADVTTAVALNDAERQKVSVQLARIIGSEVDVRSRVDEAIIGGLVARVGDQLIDGSVRTQLRELRATLARR